MKLQTALRAVAISAAAIALSACSASPQISAPGAGMGPLAPNLAAPRRSHGKSWMNPTAKSNQLLYISDFGSAEVDVYTYPYLMLAGVLSGFNEVRGECTNPAGYVWITDQAKGEVFEYAHGGNAPVNVLAAPDPIGCATNLGNGDLAVSNLSAGQIEIFHNGAGSGAVVADSNFARTVFLGYDKAGNLFVDGYDSSGNFHYAELLSGTDFFTDITLSQTPAGAGNVQWDGTYMAVGDSGSTIYQTQGSTVVSTTTLASNCVEQFFIFGGASKRRAIAPSCEGTADIFAYPAGGSPLKSISGGLLIPFGAVLSK